MLDKGKNAAIQRGVNAARHWKRTRNCVKKWDATCVGWTKSHRFPGWLGHVPIVLVLLLSVASILLGSLLIGLVVAFVWMAIVGFSSIPERDEDRSISSAKFKSSGYLYDPEPYSTDDD
jgi:hypothetical protein